MSFNDSGFFSSLCSLYSLPLSPSSALSGPPCLYRLFLYVYIILEEGPPSGENSKIEECAQKRTHRHTCETTSKRTDECALRYLKFPCLYLKKYSPCMRIVADLQTFITFSPSTERLFVTCGYTYSSQGYWIHIYWSQAPTGSCREYIWQVPDCKFHTLWDTGHLAVRQS